jgi:hypothetical protein
MFKSDKCSKCNESMGFLSSDSICKKCEDRKETAKTIQKNYLINFLRKEDQAIKKNDSKELLNIHKNLDIKMMMSASRQNFLNYLYEIKNIKTLLPVLDELIEVVEEQQKTLINNNNYLDVEYILNEDFETYLK